MNIVKNDWMYLLNAHLSARNILWCCFFLPRVALDRAEVLLTMKREMVRLDNVWGVGGGLRPVKHLVREVRSFKKTINWWVTFSFPYSKWFIRLKLRRSECSVLTCFASLLTLHKVNRKQKCMLGREPQAQPSAILHCQQSTCLPWEFGIGTGGANTKSHPSL